MRKDLTEIAVVLDRSGSMASVREDTIGGVNTFLEEQQAVPGEANFTLVQFDTEYEVVHNGVPIKDVPPLTEETFSPRGMTALYDAIGRTIHEVGSRLEKMTEDVRPGKVIVAIVTDGLENSSKEYRGIEGREALNKMVKHQEEMYSWEFVFLGATLGSVQEAKALGINPHGIAVTDLRSGAGSRAVYGAISRRLTSSRQGKAVRSMASLYKETVTEEKEKEEDSGSDPVIH